MKQLGLGAVGRRCHVYHRTDNGWRSIRSIASATTCPSFSETGLSATQKAPADGQGSEVILGCRNRSIEDQRPPSAASSVVSHRQVTESCRRWHFVRASHDSGNNAHHVGWDLGASASTHHDDSIRVGPSPVVVDAPRIRCLREHLLVDEDADGLPYRLARYVGDHPVE